MLTPCWAILFEYLRRDGLLNTGMWQGYEWVKIPPNYYADTPPPSFAKNVHTHNYKPQAKRLSSIGISSVTSQWTILAKIT